MRCKYFNFIFQKCVNNIFYISIKLECIFNFIIYNQFSSNTFLDFIPKYYNNKKIKIENNIISNKNEKINAINDNKYKDLENKLNKEIEQNKILNNKIKILTKELEDEKTKNINLNNININLTTQLNDANKNIKNLSDKLNFLNLNNNNNELQNIINMNNDEINKLKSKLNDSSLENIQPGEKILAIGFTSCDQKINNFILPCKDSELFVRIEEKLYNEYSEYKEKETYFVVGGNKIKRFKTLKENNIKSGSIIMLNIIEE